MIRQDSHSEDSILAQIIDSYTVQCASGEPVDLATYLEAYPEYASVLRDVLPTIDALVRRQTFVTQASLLTAPGNLSDTVYSVPNLPHYELQSPLGGGGMGIVVQAIDRRLQRKVAIKFLNLRQMGSSQGLERFQTEAISNARVQHPNIVQIHEVGEQDGIPYLVLEFCDGGDLATKTNGRPQAPRWSASLVASICSALNAAHQAGLIHRDIKPANILFTSDQIPKLADFGLSKQLDGDSGLTHAGTVLGTPSYMAPEQTSVEPDTVSQTADIYSLGAVLYELLVGRPPFKGQTTVETLHQVKFLDPVPLRKLRPEIPRDLETICLKCLHKERDQRYQSAMALAADLQAFLEHRPILARPVTLVDRSIKFARRSPWLATLMVMLPLSVLLGAASVWTVASMERASSERQSEQLQVAGLATAIINADVGHLPDLLQQMEIRRESVERQLQQMWSEMAESATKSQRLNVSLALLSSNAAHHDFVWQHLMEATPEQLPVITRTLAAHSDSFSSQCLSRLREPKRTNVQRFRIATALAIDEPSQSTWVNRDEAVVVARELVNVAPSQLGRWRGLLLPVMDHLTLPLQDIRRDAAVPEQSRLFAIDLLSEHLANDAEKLFELLVESEPTSFRLILGRIPENHESMMQLAKDCLHQSRPLATNDEANELLARRQAKAAAFLLHRGHGDSVWPLLKHSPDPGLRGFLIDQFPRLEVPFSTIYERLLVEPDTSIRFALLLCLGGYNLQDSEIGLPTEVHDQLRHWYANESNAGVHSAIEWLYRRLGVETIESHESALTTFRRAMDQHHGWFVSSQGQTFAIVDASSFMMGSMDDEMGRDWDETHHHRMVDRTFAIATTEVTRGAVLRWRPDFEIIQRGTRSRTDCPIGAIDWYDAAAYCNWLSEQDGIPEDQWCYEPNEDGEYAPGMKARDGFLELEGYRLPTEAEWEYACRAGTVTRRYYGDANSLLTQYAWHSPYADDQCHEVGLLRPNDFGLFDMLGNEYEWCHDLYRSYRDLGGESFPTLVMDVGDTEPANHNQRRSIRGGSFDYSARHSRSAYRTNDTLDMRISNNGFRPARTIVKRW